MEKNISRVCIIGKNKPYALSIYQHLAENSILPCVLGQKIESFNLNEKDLILIDIDYDNDDFLLRLFKSLQLQLPNISVCLFNVDKHKDLNRLLSFPILCGILNSMYDLDNVSQGIAKICSGSNWFSRDHLDVLANMRSERFSLARLDADTIQPRDSNNINQVGNLTRREHQILQCLAENLSNKEIANKLFLSAHTINSHRHNIYKKLGVNNRASALTKLSIRVRKQEAPFLNK